MSYERLRAEAAERSGVAGGKAALPPHTSALCAMVRRAEAPRCPARDGPTSLPEHPPAVLCQAASTVATLVTNPVDVIKTRLQTLPAQAAGAEAAAVTSLGIRSGGAIAVAASLLRKEGLRALWAGTLARVLSVAPGSAISFFAFESLKAMIVQ